MIVTTLEAIHGHCPCWWSWQHLLRTLGQAGPSDEPLPFEAILNSNGLFDALWALRTLGPEHHGWMRHYAVDCAERMRDRMTDTRSLEALRVARRHADGQASDMQLAVARVEAWDIAWSSRAARVAAWVTDHDAWSAAAGAAESAATGDEERQWQEERLRAYLAAAGRPEETVSTGGRPLSRSQGRRS